MRPAWTPNGSHTANGRRITALAEERVDTRIQPSFPLGRLTDEENFLSLLHYFGLLSIRGMQGVMPTLAIAHRSAWSAVGGAEQQLVKRLMYELPARCLHRDVRGVFGQPVPV